MKKDARIDFEVGKDPWARRGGDIKRDSRGARCTASLCAPSGRIGNSQLPSSKILAEKGFLTKEEGNDLTNGEEGGGGGKKRRGISRGNCRKAVKVRKDQTKGEKETDLL